MSARSNCSELAEWSCANKLLSSYLALAICCRRKLREHHTASSFTGHSITNTRSAVFGPPRGLWASRDELCRCTSISSTISHSNTSSTSPISVLSSLPAAWPKGVSHGKYDGPAFPGRSPDAAKTRHSASDGTAKSATRLPTAAVMAVLMAVGMLFD